MTREEHLLTILAEECNEVAQRCSKALRFGLDEIQADQSYTNAERISIEVAQLHATFEMMFDENLLPAPQRAHMREKKAAIVRWMDYSKKQGTLTDQ